MQFDRVAHWQPLNPPASDVTASEQKSPKQVTVSVVSPERERLGDARRHAHGPEAQAEGRGLEEEDGRARRRVASAPAGVPATIEIPVAGKGKKLIKKALKAGKEAEGHGHRDGDR